LFNIINFTDELAFKLGTLLGKIHRHSIVGYGELFDIKKSTVQNFFGLKFEEIISESVDHLPPALVEKFQEYYDAHLLNGVDGPCIVHRDFRPGNVMINEGKIQGIIDWSSAVASSTEEDFCSMEHGEWPIDASSKKSFHAGYASIRPVPNYDTILPFLRLYKGSSHHRISCQNGNLES
jgi:Ser/Thr protein kinase RdoA (MazF antagonist)